MVVQYKVSAFNKNFKFKPTQIIDLAYIFVEVKQL